MAKITKEKFISNLLIFISVIILIIVIILSTMIKPKEDSLNNNPFDISNFSNVTVIGLMEYFSSFNYQGDSIIFFCSNEEDKCFDELSDLSTIAKEYNLNVEYVNVPELVDSEKEELANNHDEFKESFYPHLIIIKNGQIVNNSNKYLDYEEIKEIFISNKII